ncbi:MAG TPA: MFS transporter [Candidatus Coprenecus stercoravium]|uniref:MFS transporter n=1 Tax=Candidatus Coprenecus stercoravium TaxID=2840735 RepID=A0A9D2GRM1_9BACT|nr:MFS transporter [Candidatus Coprenecus stercoravium]
MAGLSTLRPNQGIPAPTLLMMSAVAGLTVANLYYNQPLLESIRIDLACSESLTNLITVVTQAGYALGLLLIVPMADMWPRRRIALTIMSIAAVMAAAIAASHSIWTVLAASLGLGVCSVIPQIFIPIAGQFSEPEHKSRNMGYILSGLLTGILGARVISGYVGQWAGWRTMFIAAAVLMLLCLALTLRMLPRMPGTFSGTYGSLIKSVWKIFVTHPRMRLYALRGACAFGSMMSIWACMAFHLSGEPFHAGSRTVGLLGLCGVVGAVAASGIGKYVPRLGIRKMTVTGAFSQIAAWAAAVSLGHTYAGLIAAIILLELGAQFMQLSNQSGCLQAVPDASNRANTIFMTSLFLGGSLATLSSSIGWRLCGWNGVCLTGAVFAIIPFFTIFADKNS